MKKKLVTMLLCGAMVTMVAVPEAVFGEKIVVFAGETQQQILKEAIERASKAIDGMIFDNGTRPEAIIQVAKEAAENTEAIGELEEIEVAFSTEAGKEFTKIDMTETTQGKIQGILCFTYKGETKELGVNRVMGYPVEDDKNSENVMNAINDALNKLVYDNSLEGDTILKAAEEKATVYGAHVVWDTSEAGRFQKKEATMSEEGVIQGTLVVTLADGSMETIEIKKYIEELSQGGVVSQTPTPTVRVTVTQKPGLSATPAITKAAEKEKDTDVNIVAFEKTLSKTKTDTKDVKGSSYKKLQPKLKESKDKIKLSWKKQEKADGYLVYGAACGKKMVKLATINKNSKVSFTQKNLKEKTYYKYMVVAFQKDKEDKKEILEISSTVYGVTTGGKYSNTKKVSADSKITIKKGKKSKLNAKVTLVGKRQKIYSSKLRYVSENTSIATVSKTGVVTGKKKGSCYVYAYGQNGISKRIKIVVK